MASVSEVKGHQVRISFDGWPDELSCWMDDDSPDIHPVGWCLKTGHPLEPPLSEYYSNHITMILIIKLNLTRNSTVSLFNCENQ